MKKTFYVVDLEISPYEDVYVLQKSIMENKKKREGNDVLLLVEHYPVFTIGRRGSRNNIFIGTNERIERGLRIIDIDRGGDITFHGIGQLVAYPIFDLALHGRDVRLFIRNLERVLELTVLEYGLTPDTDKKYTGLWVNNGYKIGFIGIGVSNWITYHGISLNANVDLTYFNMIRPCGIEGVRVSSMQALLRRHIGMDELKKIMVEKFCEVFDSGYQHRISPYATMVKEKTA